MEELSNAEVVSAADKAESEVDFSKMCEGVSYSEGSVHVEQFGAKVSIVTPYDFVKMTPELFCAIKARAGLSYEQSILKVGEHNQRESRIKKGDLYSLQHIIDNNPPSKVASSEATGADKYEVYETIFTGDISSYNLSTQFMTTCVNTRILGNVTLGTVIGVQSAASPWPVRCPV